MMEKSASLHFIYSTLKAVFFIIMVCVLVGCITTDSRISVSQYPTITTSTECSNRFIEHELQRLRWIMNDWFFGSRRAMTFKKLPIHAPKQITRNIKYDISFYLLDECIIITYHIEI